MMVLYSYWRSTTSYRVRVALNLKGLVYETRAVDLVAGAQRSENYAALNPGQGVPTLVLEDGSVLTQSMAILDYLDALVPTPALLPADPLDRAHALAAAHTIAMDIHPVINLKIVGRLKGEHGASQDDGVAWMKHWMTEGFRAYQALLTLETSKFSFGETPLLCDICLVAQLYNAYRWGVDMSQFGRLLEIEKEAMKLDAFQQARPDAQPDAG
ncbi:maleylacetoacetate isomerase [Planktotalea sp.]|uniref:maleylacetoacetate isomerase n=1 Tax=Planktotalea sp. TaxID=2029877 RepID=UPI0025E60976|nr:maleylacetoacetate isomerase [Planktotalea sp.]